MLFSKIKESLLSVLPIAAIVVILSLTVAPMKWQEILVFLIGCVFVIGGLGIFSIGADVAMIPIGELVGSATTKTRNLLVIITVSFLIGVVITVAEPDLSVLASGLASSINKWVLISLVAVGVGVFLVLSMLRVIFDISLRLLLLISYGVVFALAFALSLLGKSAFLPLAFDSGGATTGPMSVPFIIAMGVGVSAISGRSETEQSFGFVALSSVGPIIAVLLLGFFVDVKNLLPAAETVSGDFFDVFRSVFARQAKDTAIAIGPIAAFFLVFRFSANRNMPIRTFWRIVFGILYTYIGIVLFMTGAHAGFSEMGSRIGMALGENFRYVLIPLGCLIGFLIVAAEPAVHVLNEQIERISGGTIKKGKVMLSLMCGVALSVGLSMLRVLFTFSIWWLILPGYVLAMLLSFFTPKVYTAIAFDSGGVASGPMSTAFLLPLATGACVAVSGESYVMGFAYGLIAMVAMTPLIVLQLLGLVTVLKARAAENRLQKQHAAEVAASVLERLPETETQRTEEIEVIDL